MGKYTNSDNISLNLPWICENVCIDEITKAGKLAAGIEIPEIPIIFNDYLTESNF